MTASGVIAHKIQSYLSGLSPRAVASLVRKLESARAAGSQDPHLDLILAASAKFLRATEVKETLSHDGTLRRDQVQRLFFEPIEEFLINENLPNRQEGRIYRPILPRIWTWLTRDLLPGDVKTVLAAAENSSVTDDRLHALVQALRARSVDAIGTALHGQNASDKERRRIVMEMGGERGLSELRDTFKILEAEKWLVPFLKTVPKSLNHNRFKGDMDVLKLVSCCAERYPDHLALVAAALLERSEQPAALCRFAGRLAHTDDPRVIAESKFAPFVDVVLSEAERLNVLALNHRQNNPDPVAFSQALTDFHQLVHQVELDIDLTQTLAWRKRLSGSKRALSDVVARELSGAPGAVRRALQVPMLDPDGSFQEDQDTIDDAVRALRVVVMVKQAPDTFAMNEMGKRTRQAVEQTLEIMTRSLLNDLPMTSGGQREAHVSAVDAAIMLSEIFYGSDFAAQLRRRRHNALRQADDLQSGAILPAKSGQPARHPAFAARP
ncbi:hypothetical protein GCM10011316_38870 [Roseibium aquae]|uniref:Uncharacterized protein n=1 Tax=Roseibium aquae TaxID=1323746 RepID=A0A916TN17_9HYPH|nr:hypothetical protein [Roseibium aquae]GGB63218.1 hypothetical protein GCM10011316_38870 [Roseibium aquae]